MTRRREIRRRAPKTTKKTNRQRTQKSEDAATKKNGRITTKKKRTKLLGWTHPVAVGGRRRRHHRQHLPQDFKNKSQRRKQFQHGGHFFPPHPSYQTTRHPPTPSFACRSFGLQHSKTSRPISLLEATKRMRFPFFVGKLFFFLKKKGDHKGDLMD